MSSMSFGRDIPMAEACDLGPRLEPFLKPTAISTAKSTNQLDSSRVRMFGCWPRHQVRMLVPERGEPTTKIGRPGGSVGKSFSVTSISYKFARGKRSLAELKNKTIN